jgi:two-component system, OmpR family, sensor histidine kinase KdpD
MQDLIERAPSSLRYALAFALLAATSAVLYWLEGPLESPAIALVFLLPVGLATALWGLGPGIAIALGAFLSFNFLFIQPRYTFAVHRSGDVVILLVFLAVSLVVNQLVARAQAGLAAATAREREATQLYELSLALAGLQQAEDIASVLADQARAAFGADRVALQVDGLPAVERGGPGIGAGPRPDEQITAQLESARGRIGTIHLWRSGHPPTAAERRLLQTYASQGALAFERARLAQAETRAQVLEESDRLKTALLSSVSHELRSPLATIKAAATSLRSGDVDWDGTARTDLLAAIDDEADQLNRLVGNLLDMSRIEAGGLHLKREWNLLSEIVGSAIASLSRLPQTHYLKVDVPEDLPLVPVDYVLIEQVFTNLLSNCQKYAPPGTTIRIHAQAAEAGTVHATVRNEGPPVPEQHLNRIFDKFYRVTAADRVTGTGLGLSICRGILEAHGGRIWAENLPGGLAFHFSLPLAWEGGPPPRLPTETDTA